MPAPTIRTSKCSVVAGASVVLMADLSMAFPAASHAAARGLDPINTLSVIT
jgi:hypothetical protein